MEKITKHNIGIGNGYNNYWCTWSAGKCSGRREYKWECGLYG